MKIPAIGDTVQGDNRMNTSQKASRLHGMGFLPLFGSAMATTTKDGEGRVFSLPIRIVASAADRRAVRRGHGVAGVVDRIKRERIV